MQRKILLTGILIAGIISCNTKKPFHETKFTNPEFVPDTAFVGYEDLTSSRFKALKEKYQLDTIFHDEADEFKRILLIRDWIHRTIKIDNYGPYKSGERSVEGILDAALKGNGFHCGHFTSVQNAILNAYGYITRCIISDTGFPVDFIEGEGHHAINEVWVNKYHKWVMVDAKYDNHFEKNGIPLSALEIRDEYFKNKAADITLMKGINRVPTESYPLLKNRSKANFARIYSWLSWGKYNNRFTDQSVITDSFNVYADEYFRTHTWLWDGKPHWAYKANFFNYVNERKAIEWTPNTITSKVNISNDKAVVELHSVTPNFKTYQVKESPSDEWKDVSDKPEINLVNDKNEIAFRTVNLAGVTGPEHKIIIER